MVAGGGWCSQPGPHSWGLHTLSGRRSVEREKWGKARADTVLTFRFIEGPEAYTGHEEPVAMRDRRITSRERWIRTPGFGPALVSDPCPASGGLQRDAERCRITRYPGKVLTPSAPSSQGGVGTHKNNGSVPRRMSEHGVACEVTFQLPC